MTKLHWPGYMELPNTAPVIPPSSTQRAIIDCPRHPIFSRNQLSNLKMKPLKADQNKNWMIGKLDKSYRELWRNHMLDFSAILIDPGT